MLEGLLDSQQLGEEYKVRPAYQLEMARKNRPGMKANDFTYTLADGRTGQLSQVEGDYTLLLFYNPDCNDCRRVEQYIAHSKVLAPLVRSKRLAVLAVYPDADLPLWRAHLPEMPQGWITGYDAGQKITKEDIYYLPAIPTLYLLDKEKRVVLKDAPAEEIEERLMINN